MARDYDFSQETGLAAAARPRASGRRRRKNRAEFWLYLALTYPIFLLVAIGARLLPPSRRPFQSRGSVFSEAKSSALTVLPFVFMG